MTSKFILKRNKFIASLVEKYTKPLDSLLDLGCGQGNLLRCMSIPVYYRGVDLNYVGNSNLIDNEDILIWDTNRKYDTIVLQEVLEHLSITEEMNALYLLQRIKKFMHDESTLVVSVPNYWRLTNLITKHPKYLDKTHKSEYSDGALDLELYETGYSVIEKQYWLLYLPFEKYIGWIVPDFLREWILSKKPTWSSHIVYVVKLKEDT